MNERHKRSTTHGLFSPWRLRETLKNVERYDSRLGLARTVVRRVKWGVRVAKQVRLIDSRVGDERQPSTRSHRSRRLRRSTDLLREITRHCTPQQRCIPWLCNTVKSRLRPTIFSFLFNPYWAANQSFFIPLLFFSEEETKRRVYSSLSLLRINVPSTPFLFFFFFRIEEEEVSRSFSSSSE